MCLYLPLTPDDERLLAQRARAVGLDAATFAAEVLRREMSRMSALEGLLAPIHADFERSGMSEDELTDLLERAKHDLRNQMRASES